MTGYPVKLNEDELIHICAVLSDDKNPRAKPIYSKLKKKLYRLRQLNAERRKNDTTARQGNGDARS